jgi:hypothetical protein
MRKRLVAHGWILIAMLCLAACRPDANETPIVSTAKSPDGRLTAIYATDIGGGAAVGISQEVYVQAHQGPLKFSDRVFSSECVDDLSLAWQSPRDLIIQYRVSPANHNSDTAFAGPWWSVEHKPPHGVRVHLVRRVSPGAGYC